MRADEVFDGTPRSATFWWIAKLASAGGAPPRPGVEGELPAARRGSGVETYALSSLAGLALLGVAVRWMEAPLGGWAWLFAVPGAFVLLHIFGFSWVGLGELAQRAGLLPPPARASFHGVGTGASLALAGLLSGAPLAYPWLAFVVVEALAWPLRKIWQITDEEGA